MDEVCTPMLSFISTTVALKELSTFHSFCFSEFNCDLFPSDHERTFSQKMWSKEMSRVPVELFIVIGGIIY